MFATIMKSIGLLILLDLTIVLSAMAILQPEKVLTLMLGKRKVDMYDVGLVTLGLLIIFLIHQVIALTL